MIAPAQPMSRTAARSATVAMPPEAMIAPRRGPRCARRAPRSGPASRPSRSMAVTSKVWTPTSASGGRRRRVDALGVTRPAVPDSVAIADIDGDGDPVRAMSGDQPGRRTGHRGGGGADDGPGGAGRQSCCDGRLGPETTGDLHVAPLPDRRDDRGAHLAVIAIAVRAASRSTTCSQRAPAATSRSATAAGSSRKTVSRSKSPCLQPHDMAAPEVDRGQDVETACR